MPRSNVEIKPIKNEEARQVCFSKRRPSVFKKASELYTLCGAEVAMVVFSSAGNAYSFGAPSIRSVASRFLTSIGRENSMCDRTQSDDSATIRLHELYQQHAELQNQLVAQNKKMKLLEEAIRKESEGKLMGWLVNDVEEMGQEDLKEFNMMLVSLRDKILGTARQVLENYSMFSNPMQVQHCVTTLSDQQNEEVKPKDHNVPSSYGRNTNGAWQL